MSEQAGSSVAVIQERQALLARQHDAVAEADRELADVLASAHAAMRESVRRLDAIAAELDRAVPDQDQLAVDTPWERVSFNVPGRQAARDRSGRRRRPRARSRKKRCAKAPAGTVHGTGPLAADRIRWTGRRWVNCRRLHT